MAKTKSEKTAAQVRADNARAAYAKAKEAFDKSENATTKKALETATAERSAAVQAESRERFERVGGIRVTKALAALSNVGKLAAPRSYHYDDEDVAQLERAIMDAAKAACSGMRAALNKGGGKTANAGFTFGSKS